MEVPKEIITKKFLQEFCPSATNYLEIPMTKGRSIRFRTHPREKGHLVLAQAILTTYLQCCGYLFTCFLSVSAAMCVQVSAVPCEAGVSGAQHPDHNPQWLQRNACSEDHG